MIWQNQRLEWKYNSEGEMCVCLFFNPYFNPANINNINGFFFLLNVPVTTEIKANLQDPSK